jgi:hypothetical protein
MEEEITEDYAKERYEICKACDKFRSFSKTCQVCNCIMPIKVKIRRTECPLLKWGRAYKENK